MRLPRTAHTTRPWRIHEIASDFRVEDVWAMPTPGGPDDFPRLVRIFTGADGPILNGPVINALFALRWKLGRWFGWDKPEDGIGRRVKTLRDRLPADLAAGGPELGALPLTSVYQTHDEWVAEIANGTVHGLMHIGWVPDDAGGYRGQMAVLVKPNGFFGTLYMAGIRPFRYLGVYPAMLRAIGQRWKVSQPTS